MTVLGTPAEEETGGKINMLDAGAFDDIDVAMMAHGAPFYASRGKMAALQE